MPHGMVWHRVHDEQQSTDNRVNPLVPFKYSVAALHFFETCSSIPLPEHKIAIVQSRIRKRMNRLMLVKVIKLEMGTARKMYAMTRDASYNFGKQ